MTTATGAWLDPLSDKLFVIVPAIALSMQGEFPWWATAVIVLREVAVSVLRWRLDQRGVSMPASRAGKAKTFSQVSAVGLSIAPLSSGWDPLVTTVIVVAVVLTIASGLEYLFTTRHRLETG
jgi:CDP-diacylglycerol---glycerol-3-phosphate 3-phosphatidyltransferase